MALVKCSECRRDVSTLAQVCPHCGAPLPRSASSPGRTPEPAAASAPGPAAGFSRPARGTPARQAGRVGAGNLVLFTFLALVVVVAVALVTRTVVIRVEAPSQGYLWYAATPGGQVALIGEEHQQMPADLGEALRWQMRGEACLAEAGTAAQVDSAAHPLWTTVSVKALSGRCAGYRGWVPMGAWHGERPPR